MDDSELSRPLIVDMDGTFLKVDSLDEVLCKLFLKNPFRLIGQLFSKLWRTRQCLKWDLYLPVEPDENLPVNEALWAWLRHQKAAGRKLILCSGSPEFWVRKVADRFGGLFDEAIGSDLKVNLSCWAKADYLVKRFGQQGFDYVGNSGQDIPVWRVAKCGYNVNNAHLFLCKLRWAGVSPKLAFVHTQDRVIDFIKAMRISHWSKNVLIAVPLLAAHRWGDWIGWQSLAGLFISLGLLASAGYLLNDIFDLVSDRATPEKSQRMIASGRLSVVTAGWGALALLVVGLAMGFGVSLLMGVGVLLYFLISMGYTMWLKMVAGLDIILLAGLYVYRIILGGVVSSVAVTTWLVVAALFFFLQMAALKRSSELRLKGESCRRPYGFGDQPLLNQLSISSACLAPVVVAVYAAQPSVTTLYTHPAWLVLCVPLLLYWGISFHMRMTKGNSSDPFKTAVHSKLTYLLAVILIGVILLAR